MAGEIEVGSQSIELIGRMLEATQLRLDALEGGEPTGA
jgi:hypothetical protein